MRPSVFLQGDLYVKDEQHAKELYLNPFVLPSLSLQSLCLSPVSCSLEFQP